MKKSVLLGAIAALGVSSAMAGSIANFTNASEQVNPFASQNAQITKQTVAKSIPKKPTLCTNTQVPAPHLTTKATRQHLQ